MPVYEVEVTVAKTMTDTVVIQAADEATARSEAQQIAHETFEPDTTDTQVESSRELSSDEALEKVGSVIA